MIADLARLSVTTRRLPWTAIADDAQGYIRGSWAEGYKLAPRMARLPWPVYKRTVAPALAAVLERPDTELLIAERAGSIVGWIALSRGPRVDTVHWVHTRFRVGAEGELLRRRGIMTALFDAADLHRRIAYTFRGPEPRGRDRHTNRLTADERIARWLASRGVTAAFVDIKDWIS